MHHRTAAALLLLLLCCHCLFLDVPDGIRDSCFTRQYKTECTTCHTIYPELNEYGQAFLRTHMYTPQKGRKERLLPEGERPRQARRTREYSFQVFRNGCRFRLRPSQSITYNEHARRTAITGISLPALWSFRRGGFREALPVSMPPTIFFHDSSY